MQLKNQNILFFTRTMKLGGTENVILQMCEVLLPHVNKIVVCSCGGINTEKLDAMGIKHYEIPDIDSKSPSTIRAVFSKIPKIIRDERITIVHTHHRMATFYMRFIHKSNSLKVVSTLHGTFDDKKFLTKSVYKKIPIIACGEVAKSSFVKNYGIDPSHITVVRNAVKKDDNQGELLSDTVDIPTSHKKIGYIGRLSSEKGVRVLIDAISLMRSKNNSQYFFFIVGTGDLTDELKERVQQEGLEGMVAFLGYRNDAQNIIKQVDAVVLPSFTEGLPLTPIEAFAQGKPVVATPAGGTVEIVTDGENGIIVPIGDKESLANGIVEMFKDTNRYNDMCKSALYTYEHEFSFGKFEESLVSFYETICRDEE